MAARLESNFALERERESGKIQKKKKRFVLFMWSLNTYHRGTGARLYSTN